MSFFARLNQASRELKIFALASLVMGVAFSSIDSILNNFLNERFSLSGFERSFLEFPRELPGFLVVFVSALLWFLCSRRKAVLAMILTAIGAVTIGFFSQSYGIMIVWLFIYSMGNHLYLPLSSVIGMELAKEGKDGQRLGQLNAVRNIATILGSALVFLSFRYFGFTFQHVFTAAALALLLAALLLSLMKPQPVQRSGVYLKVHREYRLYYALAVLFGSRKQIFMTFAPWVLVSVFNQPTQTMATLMTIGGIIGIIFQPFLGWAVDHFGERLILTSEAVLLVFVCFGYGFSRFFFAENVAFLIACACFLLDQMLMSVGMARSTYMKKIAKRPEDVQPALTLSVTIDHVFSILVALLGGIIWNAFGYQYVFLLGVGIAVINFFTALQVRVPERPAAPAGAEQPSVAP